MSLRIYRPDEPPVNVEICDDGRIELEKVGFRCGLDRYDLQAACDILQFVEFVALQRHEAWELRIYLEAILEGKIK